MHKLLLADDSVTIQRVIELTFSGEDVHVVAVNDGEQAIARIPLERPDVVLADIGMPRKGGYDVSAFVKGRADLAHIPVLLLAGAFEPVDQARAEQVQADGVLIKPFEPRQVIERVKEFLTIVPQGPPVAELPAVTVGAASVEPQPAEAEASRGPSLDELFESLNQALAEPAETPGPDQLEEDVTPAPVAAREPAPALELEPSVEPEPAPESAAEPMVTPAPDPVAEPFVVGPPLSFEPLAQPGRNSGTLDDYFDRLSAAFEQASKSSLRLHPPIPERLEDLAPSTPAAPSTQAVAPPQEWLIPTGFAPSLDRVGQATNPILEAVTALMAQTNGHDARHENGTVPPPSPASFAPPLAAVEVSQAIVDAVTDRVLARLAPEVAESLRRLVAQEIARVQHERS